MLLIGGFALGLFGLAKAANMEPGEMEGNPSIQQTFNTMGGYGFAIAVVGIAVAFFGAAAKGSAQG